jgi:hypothetical protein
MRQQLLPVVVAASLDRAAQSGHVTRSCGETYVDDDHLSGSSEHETMFGEMGFVKREASIGDFVEGAGFCDKIIPLPMQPHCTLEEAMRRRCLVSNLIWTLAKCPSLFKKKFLQEFLGSIAKMTRQAQLMAW